MSNNGKHPKSLKKILGETFTFSTVIIRPSSTDRFRYLMQFSASSILDMVMNPNPRDSLVNGSATRWTSSTWNIEKFIHELKIVHNLNHQHRRQNTNTATKNTSQENKKFKENKRTGTYCSLSRKMLLKFSSCYSRWQTSDIQVVPRIFNVTWRAPEKQIENPQNKNKGICTYDLEKWENQTSTCFLSKKLPRTAPWPWQGPWDWSFVWWGAEYLDLREYDICNQTRQEKLNSTGVYNRKAQDSTKAKMITVLLGMNIVMNRTQATINWVFIKLLINCKFGVEKS